MKKYIFKIVKVNEEVLNELSRVGYDFVTLINEFNALMRKEVEMDEVQHLDVVEEEPAEVIGCRCIEEVNKELMGLALKECGGNKKLAAERLGISMRTLNRKIKEYNIKL